MGSGISIAKLFRNLAASPGSLVVWACNQKPCKKASGTQGTKYFGCDILLSTYGTLFLKGSFKTQIVIPSLFYTSTREIRTLLYRAVRPWKGRRLKAWHHISIPLYARAPIQDCRIGDKVHAPWAHRSTRKYFSSVVIRTSQSSVFGSGVQRTSFSCKRQKKQLAKCTYCMAIS